MREGRFCRNLRPERPKAKRERRRVLGGLLDEILQRLQRGGSNLLLRGLALYRNGLLGERVDAWTVFRRRLLDGTKLEQTGDDELPIGLAQLFLEKLR